MRDDISTSKGAVEQLAPAGSDSVILFAFSIVAVPANVKNSKSRTHVANVRLRHGAPAAGMSRGPRGACYIWMDQF